ncbi:MAG: molybdopterin converting factor subunit 1 [Chloroflexi bacterium]|nr:molybdopterin converting factor subunit 1 [Chloroflexota bacterium]
MHIRVRLFASLRELAGTSESVLALADGSSVLDAWQACVSRWPALEKVRQSIALAVNHDFVRADTLLKDGDELALLPPVSGGAGTVELTTEPLSTDRLVSAVLRPSDGGLVVFSGIVRNHTDGRSVRALEYEAYPEMALATLQQVAVETEERWPMARLAIAHRLGYLEVGQVSVIVAASAPHRAEAFAACRYGIDRLKEIVPIWKKEFFENDETIWPQGVLPGTDIASTIIEERAGPA